MGYYSRCALSLQSHECEILPSLLSLVPLVITLNHKLFVYWFWTLDFQSVIVPPSLHFLAWVGLAIWFKCDDKQSHDNPVIGLEKHIIPTRQGKAVLTFRGCIFPRSEEWRPTCWNREGLYWRFSKAFCSLQCFCLRTQKATSTLTPKKFTYIEEAISYAPGKMLYRPLSHFSTHLLTASFSGLQIFTQRMWSKSQSTGLSLWNMRKNSVIIGRSLVRNILPGGHIVCVTFIEHHTDHAMILVKFSRNLQQKCSFKVWVCSSISD